MYKDSTLIPFNDHWSFKAPGAQKEENVTLPHAWNDVGWQYEEWQPDKKPGTGIYTKQLQNLPAGDLALKFEGVSAYAKIFLNGKIIAENLGAYKPFVVPLEELKRDGHDILKIEVTDKASLPLLQAREQTEFQKSPRYKLWQIPLGSSPFAGGIWRNVMLAQNANCRIDDLQIESSVDELNISAKIPAGCKLIPEMANARISGLRIHKPDAVAWSPAHPELYMLKLHLKKNGKTIQTIEMETAFMEFTIRNSEFYLNGKPYFLRGQNGFPHCNVPHDKEYISRYVSAVKAQGVEISRFHTEPPSHAWLDECDRQGIMVIFEMAIHGSVGCYPFDREEFLANAEAEMIALVREYRRHPSIVMWSLGNEMIVSSERDAGLAPILFEILDSWTHRLHEYDPRPVIPSSNGDGVDLVRRNVGDVDSVHQYGGWYVETLRDLINYEKIVRKNDTTFQPIIVTESVAAYNNDEGLFFIRGTDIRQNKVVRQRMGKLDGTAEEDQAVQAFILKEYAETLWRLRRPDSALAGYIPFGQYTWFARPFDKGPEGIRPKVIWETYRRVLGPCHIQLECWNRHVFAGDELPVTLRFYHENVELPEDLNMTVVIRQNRLILLQKTFQVRYHHSFAEMVSLPVSEPNGSLLTATAYYEGDIIAENILEIKFYPHQEIPGGFLCYDPAQLLPVPPPCRTDNFDNLNTKILVLGPFSFDSKVERNAKRLLEFAESGGRLVILEQNPNGYTENLLGSGIGIIRKLQPYWSRWAKNYTRYTDRADLTCSAHYSMKGVGSSDLERWNIDTYLASCYISAENLLPDDIVVLSVCDGLADSELMPVKHPDLEPDSSILMLERRHGCGSILICQALVGSKSKCDPVATVIFKNLVSL